MYQTAIRNYLNQNRQTSLDLRAVLFDMDGVLYDSMPAHAAAWHHAMLANNLHISKEEAFLHEGRTGANTIKIIFNREHDCEPTQELIEELYRQKTIEFNKFPLAQPLAGAVELTKQIKELGLTAMVVTGSAQGSLLNRLQESFPNTFQPNMMVTAHDVKHGKPNPEPYLMALSKGNLKPNQAIVIENAPLGVESAVGAGIFTIAVNTGPLDDQILLDAGANLLFPSMEALHLAWPEITHSLTNYHTL